STCPETSTVESRSSVCPGSSFSSTQLDSLGFEVAPARGRKPDLAPGREHDLAFLPGLGVDDKREPAPAMPTEERFQSAVMIRVPMRNHERAQFFDRNL